MNLILSATILFCVLRCSFTGKLVPCRTPTARLGNCTLITDCPPLISLLKAIHLPENDLFLRQSFCGSIGADMKFCCPRDDITSPLLPGIDVCGIDSTDRIVQGKEAKLRQFPWAVLVKHNHTNIANKFHCGGVLINERYVLTAAHCRKENTRVWNIVAVRLGEHKKSTEIDCVDVGFNTMDCAEPPVDVPVEEIIMHESYDPLSANHHNDIAILRLARPVNVTEFIRPICLPTREEDLNRNFENVNLVVAGWGKTEYLTLSDVKMIAEVPGKSNEDCAKMYRLSSMHPGNLCAGGVKRRDSCRGDSGGPLMAPTQDRTEPNWYLAGTVSYGPADCGSPGLPGVYVRTSYYMRWIVSKLRP